MADNEIDSFIQKYKLLRGAGIGASLSIETELREVSISLNCKVGRNIPPPPPKLPSVPASKVYRSPSYYRQQARRKAEREAGRESPSADKAKIEETPKKANTCIEEYERDESGDAAKDDSDSNVEDVIDVVSNGRMEETEEVFLDPDDDDDLSLQL